MNKIFTRHLKRYFSDVKSFYNGRDLLEEYNKRKPDLIISDINMPIMDGITMGNKIREIDTEIKIIFITAQDDTRYFTECMDIKPIKYIFKPMLNVEMMLEELQQIL